MSSTESQTAGPEGKAISLDTLDASKAVDNNKGSVTIKEAGVYFVIAAGQVGATKAGATGTVKLWMRQNGKDVGNSNTEQTVEDGTTAVLVCQGVGEFKAGDKLELLQSSAAGLAWEWSRRSRRASRPCRA